MRYELVVEFSDGRAVEFGVAESGELTIEGERLPEHRGGRIKPAGPLAHHLEILQELPYVAARREIALHHAWPVGLHEIAVGVAAGEELRDARGVDAGLFGQRYGFGEHGMAHADHELIDHFCHQSGADRAYPGAAACNVA